MSKMKELAALLGVEIGEEFRITNYSFIYRITGQQVESRPRGSKDWYDTDGEAIYSVLTGKSEIIKEPWKPKDGEEFFVCMRGYYVHQERWTKCAADLMAYAVGNCFRTQEEAQSHSKEVLERLEKIYDDGKPLMRMI